MKIKISQIIVMICLLAIYSCGKEEAPKPTLTVSTQEIVLGNTGLDDTDKPAVFEINSSSGWMLKSTSWLTTDISSGKSGISQITVTASETTEERVGYITIESDQSEDVRAIITVKQLDIDLVASTLTVLPTSISVEFDGKTSEGNQPNVKISTNKKWTITDLPEWITATPVSGNAGEDIIIDLMVNKNEQQSEREGSFTINAGTLSKSITITQSAELHQLTVSPTSILVDYDGKTVDSGISPTITISTNKDWTITDLPKWVTATPLSGNAGTDIIITLTVNSNEQSERTGVFKINSGYLTEEITIHQLKFKDYPVVMGGTIFGLYSVEITEHDNYWDIVTSVGTVDNPLFSLSLYESFPNNAVKSCVLEFEYQVSHDLPNFRWFFLKEVFSATYFYDLPLVKTDDVDPDNENLWTKYSHTLPIDMINDWGWGLNKSTDEMGIYFINNIACRLLIRNMTFKIEMAD